VEYATPYLGRGIISKESTEENTGGYKSACIKNACWSLHQKNGERFPVAALQLRCRCAVASQPGPSLLGCEVPLFLLVSAPIWRVTFNVARQPFLQKMQLADYKTDAEQAVFFGALH